MGKAENRVARYVLAAKDTSATAETFGSRLKAAREAAGISQKELGTRVGVFGSVIGKYEIDGGEPKASMIKKLARALNVSTDYLLNYDPQYDSAQAHSVAVMAQAISEAGYNCKCEDGKITIVYVTKDDKKIHTTLEYTEETFFKTLAKPFLKMIQKAKQNTDEFIKASIGAILAEAIIKGPAFEELQQTIFEDIGKAQTPDQQRKLAERLATQIIQPHLDKE